jgi:hypothetical protein
MTTMLTWTSSSGRRGRCDASCYDARKPHCDCICSGANHGAGHNQAVENTERLAESWARERESQLQGGEIEIVIRPGQLQLL